MNCFQIANKNKEVGDDVLRCFSLTLLLLDQRQVTIFTIFRLPLHFLRIAGHGHGRWWNRSHETKFCFLWRDTHINTLLKSEQPQYTTANPGFRVNKITVKRREHSQGGFYNSSSPGARKCEFDVHGRNRLRRWPRARLGSARGDANFPGNISPSLFSVLRARPKRLGVL